MKAPGTPPCFLNGVPFESPILADRGFLYGDGLFETMLLQSGQIPLLSLHFNRLLTSCKKLEIPLEEADIKQQLDQSIQQSGKANGKIRLTVTRGFGGHGYYPPSSTSPNVYVQLSEISPAKAERFVDLVLGSMHLPAEAYLAGMKHLNRLHYVMASRGIKWCDELEILMLTANNSVVETMHHNIFFSKGDLLLTPKIEDCGVAGVMRKLLISILAPRHNIEVKEEIIKLSAIDSFDSCFLTNAVHGFVAVRKLGDHQYLPPQVLPVLSASLNEYKLKQC